MSWHHLGCFARLWQGSGSAGADAGEDMAVIYRDSVVGLHQIFCGRSLVHPLQVPQALHTLERHSVCLQVGNQTQAVRICLHITGGSVLEPIGYTFTL